jgi:hypothetical protein
MGGGGGGKECKVNKLLYIIIRTVRNERRASLVSIVWSWSFALSNKQRLTVSENKVQRNILGPEEDYVKV